eukprot:scaffold264155_cov37-Tisochrysis_lutea.AAC.1
MRSRSRQAQGAQQDAQEHPPPEISPRAHEALGKAQPEPCACADASPKGCAFATSAECAGTYSTKSRAPGAWIDIIMKTS